MKVRITKESLNKELNEIMPVGSVREVLLYNPYNCNGKEFRSYIINQTDPKTGDWIDVPEEFCEIIPDDIEDSINHPFHYAGGKVECIDAIESSMNPGEFRGFLKGQVIKYIWRYERKGKALEDLRKAKWYLERLESLLVADEEAASE